mgnify:CR=1 FL=1
MTDKQLLKKYSKIVYKIARIGDTGGEYHDTHYCNHKGAIEDYDELTEIMEWVGENGEVELTTLTLDYQIDNNINNILERLDKALIIAKTIDKIYNLEDILEENQVYG